MKMTAAKTGKIKIGVTATVLSLVVIAAVIIVCESLGVFPGGYFDRIAVSSYMKKAHDGVEYTIISQSFERETSSEYGSNQKDNYYLYECRLDNTENKGGTFEIRAYGFEVISDGYFKDYLRNKELETAVCDTVSEQIIAEYENSYSGGDASLFEVNCDTILTYEDYGEEFDESRVKEITASLEDNLEVTVYIKGNRIDFEQYKKIAAQVVDMVNVKLGYEPGYLQLLYYRSMDENEQTDGRDVVKDGLILAYESGIESYQISFDIENESDMHYYVEISESDYKKMKIYNIVQYVYIIVVAIAVVALTALWSVRKFKKWNKEIKSEIKNDIQ